MISSIHIVRFKAVFNALEEYGPVVVFVGGAVVALYATRPTPEVRPTDDIDVIIEVASYPDYAELEGKLRSKGFINDTSSGVICRYSIQGIVVDVMPTDPGILGFANAWYPGALKSSIHYPLDDRCVINILPAPLFLATKLEAFKYRGQQEGRTSADFEDIIFVLNHRKEIWDEMAASSTSLRQYLKGEFAVLLLQPHLQEWISCHLDFSEQTRLSYIEAGLRAFVESEP